MVRAEIMAKLMCHHKGILIKVSCIGGRYARHPAGRIPSTVITQHIDVSHS